jgi:hypothetical protein
MNRRDGSRGHQSKILLADPWVLFMRHVFSLVPLQFIVNPDYRPLPESLTTRGEGPSLFGKLRLAVRVPVSNGLNTTSTWQAPPAGMVWPLQVSDCKE